MRKSLILILRTALFSTLFVLMAVLSASADPVDDVRIIKISPQDGRAIVKSNDRQLKIINVGDILTMESSELKVVEIAKGRVVFEEQTDKGKETVIIRLEDGKQRIERLTRVPEKKPLYYKPKAVGGKELGGQSGSGHGSRME